MAPIAVLVSWIRKYPVTPLDPDKYEVAYDRNQIEPYRLGCMWSGSPTNIDKVAQTFLAQSTAHGYSFRSFDVISTMQTYLAEQKIERNPSINFMPRSAPDKNKGDQADMWFPWPRYRHDTDQFGITGPDPELGPAGPIVDWLRAVHPTTTYTTSVCTGALLLGAAGVLRGRQATTHWLAAEQLRTHGAEPSAQRVVFDGKVVTGAGVSAGIDLALTLVGELQGSETAQAIQLGIEYDPQPPYDAGAPHKASAPIRAVVTDLMASAEATLFTGT